MNRKSFVGSMLGIGAVIPRALMSPQNDGPLVIPPYLQPGDTIGLTSPAGYITMEEIAPSVQQMESWGFRIKFGKTIGQKFFTFGGNDEMRLRDLQQMLDDTTIKAIMCARGGYGAIRIVDRLNFSGFLSHPKWIIGFSDITVLHSHLNRQYNVASIHSKMCNSFPEIWEQADELQKATITSIRLALTGTKIDHSAIPSRYNRHGIGEGSLVGGNLKTLETLAGSTSDLFTGGKILFVEDTGEYLYSIDRMFWNLKRTGKLSDLKGLIVGGFKVKPDDPGEEFGITLQDIVMSKVKEFNYPVCFDFPVGHQKNNFALKCGVRHRLDVNDINCTLKEIN